MHVCAMSFSMDSKKLTFLTPFFLTFYCQPGRKDVSDSLKNVLKEFDLTILDGSCSEKKGARKLVLNVLKEIADYSSEDLRVHTKNCLPKLSFSSWYLYCIFVGKKNDARRLVQNCFLHFKQKIKKCLQLGKALTSVFVFVFSFILHLRIIIM